MGTETESMKDEPATSETLSSEGRDHVDTPPAHEASCRRSDSRRQSDRRRQYTQHFWSSRLSSTSLNTTQPTVQVININ